MRRLLPTLLACAALAVAGCGGDDEEAGGTPGGATTAEEAGGGGSGTTVDMKGIKFVPMEITVPAGTEVTWTNSDAADHTVTKTGGPGPKFDSGRVAEGETFKQKLDTPGMIDYVCTIHANQAGKVTVE